jgi:hypothetical protein
MRSKLIIKILAVILVLLIIQLTVSWFFMHSRYSPKQLRRRLQLLYKYAGGAKSEGHILRSSEIYASTSSGRSEHDPLRGDKWFGRAHRTAVKSGKESVALPSSNHLHAQSNLDDPPHQVKGHRIQRTSSLKMKGGHIQRNPPQKVKGGHMNSAQKVKNDHVQSASYRSRAQKLKVKSSLQPIKLKHRRKNHTLLSIISRHPAHQPVSGTEQAAVVRDPSSPNNTHLQSNITTTWKEGTFCEEFLTKSFQLKSPVCSAVSNPHFLESVECFGSQYSSSMGTCTLRNIAVWPKVLMNIMYDPDRPKFEANENPVSLLRSLGSECRNMTLDNLAGRVEGGDYIMKAVKSIVANKSTESASVCKAWINETVFFFTAHRFHMYFRFLDYFNVHKLIGDMRKEFSEKGRPRIIRISGSDNYHFPEFDQALFPEVKAQALEDIQGVRTCFRKVVLVPKSYASPIFQCKNRVMLRPKCSLCDGKGLNETDVATFRTRVLKACSSRGLLPTKADKSKLIVMVSRKPYLRNQNDKLDHFERVLQNEDELAEAMQQTFKNTTVEVVHLENLTICEQITYGHNADVYLGVHGSGLVHLWWMREDALVYEMEPYYQIGNPTFRLLSRLIGRNYHSEMVGGGFKSVRANLQSVLDNIKQYSKL